MRLFLILIAASSTIAGNYGVMDSNPAHHTTWPRATDITLPPTERRPAMPPVLPDYKAEVFQCGMGAEMNGYCCENLTKDGVGMGCKWNSHVLIELIWSTDWLCTQATTPHQWLPISWRRLLHSIVRWSSRTWSRRTLSVHVALPMWVLSSMGLIERHTDLSRLRWSHRPWRFTSAKAPLLSVLTSSLRSQTSLGHFRIKSGVRKQDAGCSCVNETEKTCSDPP